MIEPEKERQRVSQLYAAMNDEELRRLADSAATLTDLGREVLKLELSRRGLKFALHKSLEPYDSEMSNLPCPVSCLEEWDKYARIVTKYRFWKRYYRVVALAPFAIIVFLVLRYFGESTSKVPVYIVGASLIWSLAVVFYALSLNVRSNFIRCPRCGLRFGLGDCCSSCGLPRSSKTRKEASLAER
jgi:hypothetical protein